MAKAMFQGTVVAESDAVETVEGNTYFPPDTVVSEFFTPTDKTTVCGWKGTANYYSLSVAGETAENAAWTYRDPKPAASNIENFVAFYPVVTVEA